MSRCILYSALILMLLGLTSCSDDEYRSVTEPPDALDLDKGNHHGRGRGGAVLVVGDYGWPPPPEGNYFRRYDERGDLVDDWIADYTDGLDGTATMTFGPDQHLWATSWATAAVMRFHGITGEYIDDFIALDAGGMGGMPLYPLVHGDYLYIGDIGTNGIYRFRADTGEFVDVFVEAGSQGMTGQDPQGFSFGPDGYLYVASRETGRILRYDGMTGDFVDEFMPVDPEFPTPSDIKFGPDGLMYVNSHLGDSIRRYDVTTGEMETFVAAGAGGLDGPVGMSFGPDGNLYVANLNDPAILRFDGLTGEFIDRFVSGLNGPRLIEWKMKIDICHCPPGNPDNCRSLTVDYMSGFGHVGHGDELGPCE